MKVTNNSPALQGVHSVSGVVYIKPGASRDVDFSDQGLKQAKRLPFLAIGAQKAKTEESVAKDSASTLDVLGMAGDNFMSFKSAAKKVLGDATPDKKDDIVAALIDKLTDTELKTYLGSKGVEVKDETREQLVEPAKAA